MYINVHSKVFIGAACMILIRDLVLIVCVEVWRMLVLVNGMNGVIVLSPGLGYACEV